MKNVKISFNSIGSIISIGLFIYIGFLVLRYSDPAVSPTILKASTILLIIIIFLTRNKIAELLDRSAKNWLWIFIAVFTAIFLFQIITFNAFYTAAVHWDFMNDVNWAFNAYRNKGVFAKNAIIGMSIYPNTIITVRLFLLIASIFHTSTIPALLFWLEMANILIIDLAYILVAYALKRFYNAKSSLIFISLSPFSYVVFHWIFQQDLWSDSIGLIFIALFEYLVLYLENQKISKKNCLVFLSLPLLLGFAALIKASYIVVLIALLPFLLNKFDKHNFFKTILLIFISVVIFAGTFIGGNKIIQTGIVTPKQIQRYSMPTQNWINMGLSIPKNQIWPWNSGGYNPKFVNQMNTAKSLSARQKISKDSFKKIIKKNGFHGLIRIQNAKLTFMFGVGPSLSQLGFNSPRLNSIIGNFINSYDHFTNFKNIVLTFFYVIVSLFAICLTKIYKKKHYDLLSITSFAFIGFVFFEMIWELEPRYMASMSIMVITAIALSASSWFTSASDLKDSVQ